MNRYELVEGSSAKFWEAGVEVSMLTVRFGHIGMAGQAEDKAFGNEAGRWRYASRSSWPPTARSRRSVRGRWAAVKKDARAIASQQLVRLEAMLAVARGVQPAVFWPFSTAHPLLRHLAQRLVRGVCPSAAPMAAPARTRPTTRSSWMHRTG